MHRAGSQLEQLPPETQAVDVLSLRESQSGSLHTLLGDVRQDSPVLTIQLQSLGRTLRFPDGQRREAACWNPLFSTGSSLGAYR